MEMNNVEPTPTSGMALQVLGNAPTAGREHWLGQLLEDGLLEWQGSAIRTPERVQAAIDALTTGDKALECTAALHEAEQKLQLLRPFHLRHKIASAKTMTWAVVCARLKSGRSSEALSEARDGLATARRALAQHPGRAARVRALQLAEDALSAAESQAQRDQATYDLSLATCDQEKTQRVLQEAGVVIAGLIAPGTTFETALRECIAAKEAETAALDALTRAASTLTGVRAFDPEGLSFDDGDNCYFHFKGVASACRRSQNEREGEPPPRPPLHAAALLTRTRGEGACRNAPYRNAPDMLRYLKLAERHFARTAARASLGLPPLEPPNEFLCPVTQAGSMLKRACLINYFRQKEPIQPSRLRRVRSKAPAADLESALPA